MATVYDDLDLKCQLIVDDFDEKQALFLRMRDIVEKAIESCLEDNGVKMTAVEVRIKKRDSLMGKLQRKGFKYNFLEDVTDLLGARVITLYSEDVDRVATYMQQLFEIDWKESIDKRKMHHKDSFGYNSLHYICRIPKTLYEDPQCPELNTQRFEIQMRSTLQHVWAEMEHDIGYKTEIETPEEYIRMLGRLAGMLELADEEFSRIRNSIADYRRRMETLIKAGELSQVRLDRDTYRSYIALRPFDKLLRRIATINQSEIHQVSHSSFLPLLKEIGLETLQDVEDFIRNNEEDAYLFALSQFADTDIDIIASNVALQDLLIVATMKNGGGIPALEHLYDAINGKSVHNRRLAEMAYERAQKLPFMNRK